ncbi:MAG: 2-amino-4-hydroxy-6-hydroxymethyldihydropteridine diphosphokinase [Lachnospiraceae bacterium]|nr:2-amino-4-hydroxy-6-hydroxymethyldihydropteridine diphosphokinase [Lachnospiraceae bacterium]
MGIIKIQGLKVYAYHGVLPEEQAQGQTFVLNLEMEQNIEAAARTDDLEKTTDYGRAAVLVSDWMTEHTSKLIETVAAGLCRMLLETFPLLQRVTVEVQKPRAPIPLEFETVSVTASMGRHRAYLSIGSNLGDSRALLEEAVEKLGRASHTKVVKVSDLIVTKPYGGVEQPDFLNGAVEISTILSPTELLDFLHEIEQEAGRERLVHWGPRTLDLDILFYDDLVLRTKDLTIPHADLHNRSFVLNPMMELDPGFRHPVLGRTIAELKGALDAKH